jgi:hypothetical protein
MLRIFVIAGVQQPTTEEADLAGDLLLTDGNIENLKKAHDFAMVRPEHFSASDYIELLIRISLCMQSVIAHSRKQAEELKTLAYDHKEFAALRRRLDDERTENSHLERVNVELQQQLEE